MHMTHMSNRKNKGISTLYMPSLKSYMSGKMYEKKNPKRAILESRLISINLKSFNESAESFIWNGERLELINKAGKTVGVVEAFDVYRKLRNIGSNGKKLSSPKSMNESTGRVNKYAMKINEDVDRYGSGADLCGEDWSINCTDDAKVKILCAEKSRTFDLLKKLASSYSYEFGADNRTDGMFTVEIKFVNAEEANKFILDVQNEMEKNDILNAFASEPKNTASGKINEGYVTYTDKDGDTVYKIPYTAKTIEELIDCAKDEEDLMDFLYGELASNEGVETKDGSIYWGSDIQDHLPKRERNSIAEEKIPGDVIAKVNNEYETVLKSAQQSAGADGQAMMGEDGYSDALLAAILQKYGYTLSDYYDFGGESLPESGDGVASVDFVVTGHDGGTAKVYSDKELLQLLQSNMGISSGPDDFVEKVAHGINGGAELTDEEVDNLKKWYGSQKPVNEFVDNDQTFYITLEAGSDDDEATGILKVERQGDDWVATVAKGDKTLFSGAAGKYSGVLSPDDVVEMMAIEYGGASLADDISPEDLNEDKNDDYINDPSLFVYDIHGEKCQFQILIRANNEKEARKIGDKKMEETDYGDREDEYKPKVMSLKAWAKEYEEDAGEKLEIDDTDIPQMNNATIIGSGSA